MMAISFGMRQLRARAKSALKKFFSTIFMLDEDGCPPQWMCWLGVLVFGVGFWWGVIALIVWIV